MSNEQATHTCSQAETIDKINLILLGNGDPEKGLAYRVGRMADSHDQMKDNIVKIVGSLERMESRANENYKAATTALSAIEQYKLSVTQFEAGKESVTSDRNQKITNWGSMVGIVIAIVMMFFGYLDLKRDDDNMAKIINLKPTMEMVVDTVGYTR
jgi:hypothetical protein